MATRRQTTTTQPANTPAPNAEAAVTLTETDKGALHQYGAAFAASFAAVDLNIAKIQGDAADLAALLVRLGADKSYPAYKAARAEFVAGTPADKSAEARAKMWERAYAAARDSKAGATLPKGGPASTEAAAVQKAAKRAEAKAAEAADKRTPAELIKAAGDALKAGDAKAAADMLALSKRKQREADEAARKAAHEKTAPMAEAIRKAVSRLVNAGDATSLAKLHALALKLSPAPAEAK